MHASPEDIAIAIALLRCGRLVAFPTETVYGLGAEAFNAESVAAVFAAKGRPASNPLIVHVADEAMARRVCAHWPPSASLLASRFWPGPLTLVLPKAPCVPDSVTAGGPTVAVRCPSHPLTLALIETLGTPLVGPSANRSGAVSPTCAEHVRESFGEDEVFVLDGGPCVGGIESTVLDLTGGRPRVLRPGLITPEQIAGVLGGPVEGPAAPIGDAPARSPGMMRSHYAPAAPLRVVEGAELAGALAACAGPAAVLTAGIGPVAPPHQAIAMPGEPGAYAARLYAALREADACSPSVIVVVRPWGAGAPTGVWRAIADRLERAAAPRAPGR
jgi:L-threonylcarbamoyladenylate synthase